MNWYRAQLHLERPLDIRSVFITIDLRLDSVRGEFLVIKSENRTHPIRRAVVAGSNRIGEEVVVDHLLVLGFGFVGVAVESADFFDLVE